MPSRSPLRRERISLLAALAACWGDQQLQIPPPLKPQARPIRRLPGLLRCTALAEQ